MPKFRGKSEEWLDDEKSSRHSRGRREKKSAPGAEDLPWEEANATVAEVHPKLCKVRFDDGSEALCSFRRAAVARQGEVRERSMVAVGDRVKAVRSSPDAGVVEGLCARRNRLMRPAPGQGEEGSRVQIIAANLDAAVIVVSAREPDFSPGLLDRFLIGAHAGGVPAIICVTKIDLVQENSPRPWLTYREIGYPLHETCAKSGQGVQALRDSLKGKTILFCGQSGVGKTSILNQMTGQEVGKVGELSGSTGRGRHTTTVARMIDGPEGSLWIDSPGVREFGLQHVVASDELAAHYPEFLELNCAIPGCTHEEEEGCAARDLPRHEGYLRILKSLRDGEG